MERNTNLDRQESSVLTQETPASSASGQHELKVFAGPGNPHLGLAVADWLNIPLGRMHYSQFADGENYVRFEESVRGVDAYIIQPTCPPVDTDRKSVV